MYPHENPAVLVQELDEIRYPSAYDGAAWGDPAGCKISWGLPEKWMIHSGLKVYDEHVV